MANHVTAPRSTTAAALPTTIASERLRGGGGALSFTESVITVGSSGGDAAPSAANDAEDIGFGDERRMTRMPLESARVAS